MPIDAEALAQRAFQRGFVEACMLLEEGIAGVREIDLAMVQGVGMALGPFARADQLGLDALLATLEDAAEDDPEFEPPMTLRRLVAQGRLGVSSGQGFYPYPNPEPGFEDAAVKLELRGEVAIVWLDNPPANLLSEKVIDELRALWPQLESDPEVRVMVLASPNLAVFSGGADLASFANVDEITARKLVDRTHALLRSWEQSGTMTIAAVNGPALGGGCEFVMACDVRLASHSASFGQPEIKLGIMPGFGGSQRLPRMVGHAKALEMNATGEAISAEEAFEHGLVNRVVADHELFDCAIRWARMLSRQSPMALRELKLVSYSSDLDGGIAAETKGFATLIDSADAREGVAAFLEKRAPRFRGR